MQKIISLFQRNYFGILDKDHRLVRDELVPGAEWVQAGEGVATRKYDGTCCMILKGVLYKRHDVKKGRVVPEGFIPAQDPDPQTGHWPGWLIVGQGPEDRYHIEAMANATERLPDGTYELVGPKIQFNPEGYGEHLLVSHEQAEVLGDCPRDFAGLKDYLETRGIEGVVWHHPDGRMVKIKAKDFGWRRDDD